MNLTRIGAIMERELRKAARTPGVFLFTMMMPLLQLAVLGHALGGRLTHLKLGVVDADGGPAARRVEAALQSLLANGEVVEPVRYATESEARDAVRAGDVKGAIVLPADFSRHVYAGTTPRAALLLDNTDQTSAGALRAAVTGALQRAQREVATPRFTKAVTLDAVELFPFVPYIQFMLPGVLALGIFMSSMMGGTILYLDDKMRGVHEGYLATPITGAELVLAQVLAGTVKATAAGMLLATIGALTAGVVSVFEPPRFLALTALVALTSLAFMTMTSCITVRMNNPVAPRAIFGALNTLLYFPSGALYPTEAMPGWLRGLAHIDPFYYAVHALRVLLLKGAMITSMLTDLLVLGVFSLVMYGIAVRLFKRSL